MSYYIGLMSGTSVDAVDAVLVDIQPGSIILTCAHTHPIEPTLRSELLALFTPGPNEIDRLGRAHRQLGIVYSEAVEALLHNTNIDRERVIAIGNHGQTIRHRPRLGSDASFSLQIGDSHHLAQSTGICVVADFRARDISVGGQGAPLVPGFHQAVFGSTSINRCVLNLGGIANVTFLPTSGGCTGFDTGPGNGLMDAWINHNRQLPFDANGQWAASGTLDYTLLALLLDHPFLAMPPPKSTGKEEFTLTWLQDVLAKLAPITPQDVQRTLAEFTAISISTAIQQHHACATEELYVCGGGVENVFLWQRLAELIPVPIFTTAQLGVAPQWVEAMAFAWLAMRCLEGLPGNVPNVTGAKSEVVLGAIYPAGRPFSTNPSASE